MGCLGFPHREGSGQETKTLYADLDAPLATLSALPTPAGVRDCPQAAHPVPWTLPCTLCPEDIWTGDVAKAPSTTCCSQWALGLSRAVKHRQILPHTEVQDCADETASTASQSLPTGFLLPQTCHSYYICLPKSSKDNANNCRKT